MNDYKLIDQQNKGKEFICNYKPTGKLVIGRDCDLNDAIIDKTGDIYIGDRVHFGHQVMLLTTSHPIYIFDGNKRKKILHISSIDIGDDVYIGSRALILKGVKIGKSSYIAAGSMVKEGSCIGNYELWGGNPAKLIKSLEPKRDDYDS